MAPIEQGNEKKGKNETKPIFNLNVTGPVLPGINSGNSHYKQIRVKKKATGFCRYEVSAGVECGRPLRGKTKNQRLYCHIHKDTVKRDNRSKYQEYDRKYSRYHTQPGTIGISNNITFDKENNPIFERSKEIQYYRRRFNNNTFSGLIAVVKNPPVPFRVCDECGSKRIRYDPTHGGVLCCLECGLVLSEPYGSTWNYPDPQYDYSDLTAFSNKLRLIKVDKTQIPLLKMYKPIMGEIY